MQMVTVQEVGECGMRLEWSFMTACLKTETRFRAEYTIEQVRGNPESRVCSIEPSANGTQLEFGYQV